MNKVLLTGRLTRDPEMRSLASGKNVTTFTVASNEFIGGGREKAEYHPVVTWDRLAEIAGTYLGKGQQVAIEGRLQTRSWDDDRGQRHWKTEIVASPRRDAVAGARKKDYEAQQAADSLVAQAEQLGEAPAERADPPRTPRRSGRGRPDDDDEDAEADPTLRPPDDRTHPAATARLPPASSPLRRRRDGPDELEERHRQDRVDDDEQRALQPVRLAVHGDERADAHGRRDGGDLEGLEDEVHGLADEHAEDDQDRRHEQRDLEARAVGHGHRELHLVLGRELHGDEVLGQVADGRDEHDADEERRQPEGLDEALDRAHEDLRQDRQQGGRDEQHDDRDGRAPGRTGVARRLAVPAQRRPPGS